MFKGFLKASCGAVKRALIVIAAFAAVIVVFFICLVRQICEIRYDGRR